MASSSHFSGPRATSFTALAETWSEVWGGQGRRVNAENFFAVPSKMWNWGGRRGTHCIREFQYLTHGFCVYIVDFVDFNI